MDEDVAAEARLVMSGEAEQRNVAITVNHLTKRFGNFTAVNRVTFAVDQDQCFVLLGHNGAGKVRSNLVV